MFDHLSDELASVGQGQRDECPALEAAGMLPSYSSYVSSSEGLTMGLALVTHFSSSPSCCRPQLSYSPSLDQSHLRVLGEQGAGHKGQNNLCSPDWSTWDICQAWMGHPEGLGRTPHHEVTCPPSPFGGCGLSFFICK